MYLRSILALCGSLATLPAPAVDFGVMESGNPVGVHELKFEAYPLFTRKTATQEENSGVNVGLGYGVAARWDLEAQVATYDDIDFFGADAEYSFVDNDRYEGSVDLGAHYGNSDFGNQVGVDFAPLASYKPASLPGFKWNGALGLAWDDVRYAHGAAGRPERYLSAYLAPGAQYRIARDVDLIGEVGIGLNGDSNSYVSAGLSFYFRRSSPAPAAPRRAGSGAE